MLSSLEVNKLKRWILFFFKITIFYSCKALSLILPKMKSLNLFMCNEVGNFGGNISPLVQEFKKNGQAIVVLSSSKKVQRELGESGIKCFSPNSLQGIFIALIARQVITECGLNFLYTGLLAGSRVYQLWHGANLKYIQKQWDEVRDRSKEHFIDRFIRNIKLSSLELEWVLSPSSFYKEHTFSKSFYAKKVIVAGYPRNDIFFRNKTELDKISIDDDVCNYASIFKRNGGKVIVYCPTWRDNAKEVEQVLPFEEDLLVDFLKQNNYLLVIKKHHRDARVFYPSSSDNIRIYDFQSDIYCLLKDTDLLVTDYSSIYFDYLLLDRPVVFYPYDVELYNQRDRSFQFDYDDFTPGKKCFTQVELFEEIKKALGEEREYYKRDRDRVLKLAFDPHCRELASNSVYSYIQDSSG